MPKIKEVNSYIPINPIYSKECGIVNAVINLFYDNGFREDAEEMTKVWQNGVTKELLTGVHQFFSKIADRTIQVGSDFGRQKISCAETIKEANYIPCILNQLLLNAQEYKNLLLYGDLRYPYNLIQEVYSLSPSETSTFIRLYEDASNDIANTTAYAIASAGRAALFLEKKYRDDKTLAEIGREESISTERARQLILKGRKRISENIPKKILFTGLKPYYESAVQEERNQRIKLRETFAQLKEKLEQERADFQNPDAEYLAHCIEQVSDNNLCKVHNTMELLNVSIDEFAQRTKLSMRSRNHLLRYLDSHGLPLCLGGLLDVSAKDIRECSNLGEKQFQEITFALKQVGFCLK